MPNSLAFNVLIYLDSKPEIASAPACPAKIIVDTTVILAKNQEEASKKAIFLIPEQYRDQLYDIQVCIRAF